MPNPIAWARQRAVGLTALLVFLASLALFVPITPTIISKVWYPTGDEPYYLLIAHSLIHDGDIELSNNFDNKDYWHYYPGELYPRHEAKTTAPGLYSKHAPGVALLIAPAYAVLDWAGGAYVFNVIGALLAVNIYLLAYQVARKQWVALLLWLTISFTNPVMSYSFLIFPALPSALLTVYPYRRIRLDGVTAPLTANGPVRMFVIALCLGFLPWLHARFLPISFVLFVYLVWREWAARRWAHTAQGDNGQPIRIVRGGGLLLRLLVFFVPCAIAGATFLAYFKILYDTFLPNYSDHAGMSKPMEWVVAFFGSFLDQQWGFFIHAPVYILAITGLWLMLRQRRWGEVFWLAAIAVPYAVIILTYVHWWGEWCPAARYWVSLVPLLGVPMAYLLSAPLKRRFFLLFAILVAVSWAIMALFMYEPRLMYNHPTGSSRLLEWLANGPHLQPLLPTYFRAEWSNVWLTIIYSELVALIAWLGWRGVKRQSSTQSTPSPSSPR